MEKEHSLLIFDNRTATEYFFVHLATHLHYHLWQINYH